MNWLDWVLIALCLASVIAGLMKGLARTLIDMATLVAAILLSFWFYGVAASFVVEYTSHKNIANFIGFVAVFLLVTVAGRLAAWAATKVLKLAGLQWLDRMMGAGAGLVRATLVAMVLILALMSFARNPPPQSVAESRLAPYVVDASRLLVSLAPRELRDGFYQSYEKLKELWRDAWKEGVRRIPAQAF